MVGAGCGVWGVGCGVLPIQSIVAALGRRSESIQQALGFIQRTPISGDFRGKPKPMMGFEPTTN
ncbi:MAG UNVERIFIED_CONTAM: hypothetical protein LVR29_19965 [Microcystis novacekii LVE1205-3]